MNATPALLPLQTPAFPFSTAADEAQCSEDQCATCARRTACPALNVTPAAGLSLSTGSLAPAARN